MKNFNIKKFITATVVLIGILLVCDFFWDKLSGKFDLNTIFSIENLFWKVAAGLAGAYFYATFKNEEDK